MLSDMAKTEALLKVSRQELLDLSFRNSLLNYRPSSARGVEVGDEISREIFKIIAKDKKPMSFLPDPVSDKVKPTTNELPLNLPINLFDPNSKSSWPIPMLGQPEGKNGELDKRHTDRYLQTRLTSDKLQSKLLKTFYFARTSLEEQGISILYLALGSLIWEELGGTSKTRRAPLLLIPVELERANANTRFSIQYSGQELGHNLSLEAKLEQDFKIALPTLPENAGPEDVDVDQYFMDVEQVISYRTGWRVERNEIALDFFSFGKFLMYKDLDPDSWPVTKKPASHPVLRTLFEPSYNPEAPTSKIEPLDNYLLPGKMSLIMDADSSQLEAILRVQQEHNLVIQGPPGTGKSQTITNIISQAVADNKTVLFVTEKMAALEVVKKRLDNLGLGQACLELHSHKAEKKKVLEELKVTRDLTMPVADSVAPDVLRYGKHINLLATHSQAMNTPINKTSLTLYQILGELSDFRQKYLKLPKFKLVGLEDLTLTSFEARSELLEELITLLSAIGDLATHSFRGAKLYELTPVIQAALEQQIDHILDIMQLLEQLSSRIATALRLASPASLIQIEQLQAYCQKILQFPERKGADLRQPDWISKAQDINSIFEAIREFKKIHQQPDQLLKSEVWGKPTIVVAALETCLSNINKLEQFSKQLTTPFTFPAPRNVEEAEGLIQTGQHILSFPSVTGLDLTLEEWHNQTQNIALIFSTATQLGQIYQRYNSVLRPEAWQQDLKLVREHLANYGVKLLRNFVADYKKSLNIFNFLLQQPTQLELPAQLEILDAIISAQQLQQTFQQLEPLGKLLFKERWQGLASDWGNLWPLTQAIPILQAEAQRGFYPNGILLLGQFNSIQLALYAENLANYEKALNVTKDGIEALLPLFKVKPETLFDSTDYLTLQTFSEQKQLFESLRKILLVFSQHELLAQNLFQQRWQSFNSNWEDLGNFMEAVQILRQQVKDQLYPATVLDFVSLVPPAGLIEFEKDVIQLEEISGNLQQQLAELLKFLELDETKQFGSQNNLVKQSFTFLKGVLENWHKNLPELRNIVNLNQLQVRFEQANLQPVFKEALDQAVPLAELIPAFRKNWMEALLNQAYIQFPSLKSFNFATQEQSIATFRQWDKATLVYNQKQLALKHWQNLPGKQNSFNLTSIEQEQIGFLNREMEKKRAHKPIRKLIEKSGRMVQRLKPVFMMSPLSVAQFLQPGVLDFDLVVFDEASQIKPVDGFGAILRGHQVVVVGDDKQLPPTAFFEKIIQGSDDSSSYDDEAEELQSSGTADLESILSLFMTRFEKVMLNWHYRSRHESLISISNTLFYNNNLVVFPSPDSGRKDSGLIYRHLDKAVYDRGHTRTNPVEAWTVANAVLEHIQLKPELSLGVATFSVAQRDAILDQLEVIRRQNPNIEFFFNSHPSEPFFVKNLENVQGDERDVIFISTGYGRDSSGKVNLNFGPLTAQGGERRLNVLISRAKQRCEIFTNLTPDDIDFNRSASRGNQALHAFLEYAYSGILPHISSNPKYSSIPTGLEIEIAATLQAKGYNVEHKVGPAGNEMDLVIGEPNNPARYLMGFELDGPIYGQARSTRDRDRLRPQILKDLGWNIYRVWSLEWFLNPQKEASRLLTEIENITNSGSLKPDNLFPIPLGQIPERDFILALEEVLRLGGPTVLENGKLFGNLFNDLKPSKTEPWQRNLLEQIVKEGIVREIGNQTGQTLSSLDKGRWVKNLVDNHGFEANRVEWAIDCWRKALERFKI